MKELEIMNRRQKKGLLLVYKRKESKEKKVVKVEETPVEEVKEEDK